ncbi:MAG: 1-acyl-sn-glycerol-3-phosphate acyltransferase [Eubacterium sp.]|nr:1-acyl-sn-glycerol-3-phosphate acyltransferase [Eubacterium sp.]
MFKLFAALIYVVIAVIFCLPYHLYLWILSKTNRYKSWQKCWKFVQSFFKGLLNMAGTEIEIKGLENLSKVPSDKGILFLGNHRSYFDIIILQAISDRPLGFIAKKEFKKVPLFSWWVADLGSLFLDRKDIREGLKTINQGTEYMKQGLSLGLFPEGTRNHGKELLPFKTGGYRMAEKSQSPMVLCALTGFDNILENNKPLGLKKCKVTVEFSEPFYPHEMDAAERKQFYSSIPDKIRTMLDSEK